MHRGAARQAGRRRPQRVIWCGQQQFIAVIEQAIGGHADQFAGPIAQVNIVQGDVLNALLLGVVHHSFACRKNALAVGVARRVAQVADHVLLDFFRRVKTKHRQIADVELDDFLTLVFHLTRAVHDRSPNVVTDIGQFG